MQYRVVEDLERPQSERFLVQHSFFGHVWGTDAGYPDQLSAEIEMERLAAGPRVIAELDTGDPK